MNDQDHSPAEKPLAAVPAPDEGVPLQPEEPQSDGVA